jgi:hypothetical protein
MSLLVSRWLLEHAGRLLTGLVALALPSSALADAWDDEMRAEHAAAASTPTSTAAPGGAKAAQPETDPLPLCRPAIDRCPVFVQAVSDEPLVSALGLEGPSELQRVVEGRWQARSVPRRTGAPAAWTPAKASRKARKATRR